MSAVIWRIFLHKQLLPTQGLQEVKDDRISLTLLLNELLGDLFEFAAAGKNVNSLNLVFSIRQSASGEE
jgi:hypothetical protein